MRIIDENKSVSSIDHREDCQKYMLKGPVIFLLLFKVLFIILAMTFAVNSVESTGWGWTVYLAIAIAAYEVVDLVKTINILRFLKPKQ